ncbi:hypothetical protein, partial [Xanthomonas campestris]|uniref:hypothetical protein n=1 Tax=Xanthomonas campestris TaxID=339 RepID=UPI0039C3AD13
QKDLAPGLLALAQALSVTERQLHGSLLNMRRVVSRICGALFRGSLTLLHTGLSSFCFSAFGVWLYCSI